MPPYFIARRHRSNTYFPVWTDAWLFGSNAVSLVPCSHGWWDNSFPFASMVALHRLRC
jgi:hypothetical protein